MDSLPFGGDNDCTLPQESDQWLHSVPMQELLAKEGEAKHTPTPDPGHAVEVHVESLGIKASSIPVDKQPIYGLHIKCNKLHFIA